MSLDIIPGVSLHARQRMIERHGFDPPRDEWLRVVVSIVDRRALLMGRNHETGRERFRVVLCGTEVEVWWAPECGVITTVMARHQTACPPIRKMRRAFPVRAYERERRRPRFDVEDFA